MEAGGPDIHAMSISGPVTLYEASVVRDALIAALEEGKALRIDLDESGPWDVAGLQLLVSVVETGRKAGRDVRFVRVPGVCREVAERSGLADWLAGAADSFA